MFKQYPNNRLSAQLLYLKTIAEGHNEKIGPFTDSLKQIAVKYPDDKLVTPLINEQLAFISANLTVRQARPVVLANEDAQEIPFTLDPAYKKETAYRPTVDPRAIYALQKPQQRIEKPQPKPTPPAEVAKVTPPPVVKPPLKKPDTVVKQQVVIKKPDTVAKQPI